jgi:hypothetical protein
MRIMENEELKQTAESGGSHLNEVNEVIVKLYCKRNPIEQGMYYLLHIQAMTAEDLHSKADIAKELAHRDIEINRLLGIITQAHDRLLRGDSDHELLGLLETGWS